MFGSLTREADESLRDSFLGGVFLLERQVNDESLKVRLGVGMR